MTSVCQPLVTDDKVSILLRLGWEEVSESETLLLESVMLELFDECIREESDNSY
jgi:hypothetical protein